MTTPERLAQWRSVGTITPDQETVLAAIVTKRRSVCWVLGAGARDDRRVSIGNERPAIRARFCRDL
jgi:hypothetical protein